MAAVAIAIWMGGNPAATRPRNLTESLRREGRAVERAAPAVATRLGSREQILKAYAKLPLTFVENQGQADGRVRYYGQGPRYSFYLTPEAVVLSFVKGAGAAGPLRHGASAAPRISTRGARGSLMPAMFAAGEQHGTQPSNEGVVLALRFLGANPRVMVDGEERASGEVNYFRGNQSALWHTGVPRYAQVVYRELWPGVDLRLHEQAGTLKYEFRVRPGARPEDIHLAYSGAEGLRLDAAGGLLIQTALGVLRDSPPVSYQEIAGVRMPVQSRYALTDVGAAAGKYGFAVDVGYRPDHELIIDPGVDYSTFLGGSDVETGTGIAVDAAGNAYIVGTTQSADYPTTVGAFQRTGATLAFSDVFVAKLNPTGTALLYSTFIGGADFDWGRAIAIDAAGNAYITGQTKSAGFPTTKGAFSRTFGIPANCPRCAVDNYHAFVTKLNPTGSALVYSTFLGGTLDIDDALGIAVDAVGSAYVTGETASSDFPVTPGAFRTTRNVGAPDAYVTKLNPAGSALVYSTFLGGTQVDFGVRIAVDASNNAYVLGNTSSTDFPTTTGAFDTIQNGGFDLFVVKLNAAGSNLIYSTYLGGLGFDSAGGLAIDSAGNAYVAGATLSTDYPTTPGAFQTVSQSISGEAGFVTKLNPTGTALVFSTFLGDAGVSGIALTPAGNMWLAGATTSLTFPTTPDAFHATGSGSTDAFITELNAAGSAILYSTYLGGSNPDFATDVKLDSAGNVYVTGETMSADFPTTPNAFDRVFKGSDAFVTKLLLGGAPPPAAVSSVTTNPSSVVGGDGATGTVTLNTGAPAGGALVSLSSGNTAAAGVPVSVPIAAGAVSATFTVATSPVAINTGVTITATYNGAVTTTLTVRPVPSLQSLTLSPSSVVGGNGSQGTVTLTSAAPLAGALVPLTSSNTALATVTPSSVKVAPGATSATFPVSTVAVTATASATIGGTFGGASASAGLTVTPPIALSSFVISPASVAGRTVSFGTVTVTSAAPSGGFPVSVSTSDPTIAAGPSSGSVTVAVGATSASFAIGTNAVTASKVVTFTASAGGVTRTATLTVTPPQTATLTVTATGRSGQHVTSSPAGINVATGSSMPATFTPGTSITLTVSNGRNAVWSGACASGASKTCTFTLTANAAVTANVQ